MTVLSRKTYVQVFIRWGFNRFNGVRKYQHGKQGRHLKIKNNILAEILNFGLKQRWKTKYQQCLGGL